MIVQSPSQKKKIIISGKCIARFVTLLWGTGLGVCGFLIMKHHNQAILETQQHHDAHLPGFYGPKRRNNIEEETLEQQAQRIQASRDQQSWLSRRYKLMGKMTAFKQTQQFHQKQPQHYEQVPPQSSQEIEQHHEPPLKEIQEQPKMKGRRFLPSWLLGGDYKKAMKGDSNQQYDRPECIDFKRDIMRPTHGCQVNTDLLMVFCNFENLRIDVSKIKLDPGGEDLESVMGREERREIPVYEKGAFETNVRPNYEVPMEYRSHLHYMEDVLHNLKYPKKSEVGNVKDLECAETWAGTTLFITRYEYVNMYHTLTDWWNAFFVMPPKEKVRLVFLDGHAKGNLDSVWEHMFGEFTYVQHLPKGGVCFEKAIFIPAGYSSALFPDMSMRLRCPRQILADEFSNHVLKSFNLQSLQRKPGKIVIIDRKPYVAHPRSKPENTQRILGNLGDLRKRLLKIKRVTSVEVLRLETMTFEEQLRAIREARILIGNHGAGLSHLMFMDRKSDVLELTVDYYDFFIYLCEWKGVQHTPIEIAEGPTLSLYAIEHTVRVVESIVN